MKKSSLFCAALLFCGTLMTTVACSETDGTENEYPNWQAANEVYFDSVYNAAKAEVNAGSAQWKILKNWSYEDAVATHSYDNIAVKVIKSGTGTASPFYGDSVKIHLQGRIKQSVSYPAGRVFEQTYAGTFNPATAPAVKRAVSGVVQGLQTALQNMHVGDEWEIYVPYQLGYGSSTGSGTVVPSSASVTIPGYSTLVYRLTLVSFYRVGEKVPTSNAKQGVWIEE